MLKQVAGSLTYLNNPTADADRDAMAASLTTELSSTLVIPEINSGQTYGPETSIVTNNSTTKILTFLIFYEATNAGINVSNTLWTSLNTELGKATVTLPSSIMRCTSYHDVNRSNHSLERVDK